MYNKLTKDMLSKVCVKDADVYKNQKRYYVNDSFSNIEIYIGESDISYRVQGDAYIVAMTKWLQLKLVRTEYLQDITLEYLVELFDLPEVKFRNAVQVLELIEQIKASSK